MLSRRALACPSFELPEMANLVFVTPIFNFQRFAFTFVDLFSFRVSPVALIERSYPHSAKAKKVGGAWLLMR